MALKICLATLSSRITVHLIGCSAGSINSASVPLSSPCRPAPGGWGALQVLKILVLQRPCAQSGEETYWLEPKGSQFSSCHLKAKLKEQINSASYVP